MLEKVNNPQDLKKLSIDELNVLASDIRNLLIEKIYATGGHMGSNLGIVELTIAMHYVFNSPVDKFIFDVSHQTYTHKILTGRKDAFINKDLYDSISGFSTPKESKHDLFKIGHTSTSISLACGICKARDIKKENYNVIALIGDGALSGGEAFEGLNNASLLNSNLIIVINDNEMSISNNQGGLYDNLTLLRKTNGTATLNYFKALGFDYKYVEDGNDINSLINAFLSIKNINHPIVLHVHTLKGKGLEWAEQNKEKSHWVNKKTFVSTDNYANITADFLLTKMKNNKKIVAISPATPLSTGLTPEFRKQVKDQFIDVGICESHAITFASALAKLDIKPVVCVSSSFLQRAYDQLNQDLAMNNCPATILVYNAKIAGGDCTHVGQYDIALLSHIPNLVCLAPVSKNQYLALLDYSLKQKTYPMVIRVPSIVIDDNKQYKIKTHKDLFTYQITNKGSKVAILALGNFYTLGKDLLKELEKINIQATLINPICYSSLDTNTLDELLKDHDYVITLEDGLLESGFGYKIANYYAKTKMKVLTYGGDKNFNDLMPLNKIYHKCHLNVKQIVKDLFSLI